MYITLEEDKPMDKEEVKPTGDGASEQKQSVFVGIIERAGKARAELAELLRVPAVWPAILTAVKAEHNAHEALVDALKGVSIMLNTELAEYESEPWAQRVRAALALVDGNKETK